MVNKQLSKHFWSKEFGNVIPDPRLLWVLEFVREQTGYPITITSGARSVQEHVAIYRGLDVNKKIKTKENGLGDIPLFKLIPWQSRHLPRHRYLGKSGSEFLLASDIKCNNGNGGFYTGKEIETIINQCLISADYYRYCASIGKKQDSYLGLGIGDNWCHVDTGRERPARWSY